MSRLSSSSSFTVSTIEDGVSAPYLVVTPTDVLFDADADGVMVTDSNPYGGQVKDITVEMWVDSAAITLTSISNITTPTGIYAHNVQSNNFSLIARNGASEATVAGTVSFTAKGKDAKGNEYTTKGSVTIGVLRRGREGERGKMGRNYYYAGEYDANTSYTVTSTEAPFVTYNNQRWVRIGDDDTSCKGIAPSDYGAAGTYWERMTQDFKYLITEALFTEWARLGAWIYNGDYMFSNDGSGAKASFDDGGRFYGETSSTNTYLPNIVLNAKTGYARLGGDVRVGGFTFKQENSSPSLAYGYNPFGRNDYMNAVLTGGSTSGMTQEKEYYIDFPACGANVLWSGVQGSSDKADVSVVLPFAAALRPSTSTSLYTEASTGRYQYDAVFAPFLAQATRLVRAMEYVDSSMLLRVGSTDDASLTVYGARGFGVMQMKQTGSSDYEITISEYEPYGYWVRRWTLSQITSQHVTRSQVIAAIKAATPHFYNSDGGRVGGAAALTNVVLATGTSGQITATVSSNYDSDHTAPLCLYNGQYLYLRCTIDSGEVTWEIEDAGSLPL